MEQQIRGLSLLAFAAVFGLAWLGLSAINGDQTLVEISAGAAMLLGVVGLGVLIVGLARERF